MQHRLLAALLGCALAPAATGQTTLWTQSVDNQTVMTQLAASCLVNPAGITDNSFWRTYARSSPSPPNGTPAVTGDFEITEVHYGVDLAATATGVQTVRINVWEDDNASAGPVANLVLLGSEDFLLADTSLSVETAVFSTPVLVPAAVSFVTIEVRVFNGQPQGDLFFLGANSNGELPVDSTYLSAADCGVLEPVPYSFLGFADVHGIIEFVSQPHSLGTSYCAPAVPNSTGLPAVISATGSASAAANDLHLLAVQIPQGQFGYFLASQTQGMFTPPLSSGIICLGGSIARFNQPGAVGQGPVIAYQVDTTNVPVSPPVAIGPGDTWNFQLWYRDIGSTSNFTQGLEIAFN